MALLWYSFAKITKYEGSEVLCRSIM